MGNLLLLELPSECNYLLFSILKLPLQKLDLMGLGKQLVLVYLTLAKLLPQSLIFSHKLVGFRICRALIVLWELWWCIFRSNSFCLLFKLMLRLWHLGWYFPLSLHYRLHFVNLVGLNGPGVLTRLKGRISNVDFVVLLMPFSRLNFFDFFSEFKFLIFLQLNLKLLLLNWFCNLNGWLRNILNWDSF